jgi:hypothetical protein
MRLAFAIVTCVLALAPLRSLAAGAGSPAAFEAGAIVPAAGAARLGAEATVARHGLAAMRIAPIRAAGELRHEHLEPAKVAGVWTFNVELAVGTGHPTVTLKQEGEKITGTYEGRYGPSPLEGTVKDQKIEFTVSMTAEGTAVTGVFTGTVQEEGMSGTMDFEGAGDGTWTAVRKAPPK